MRHRAFLALTLVLLGCRTLPTTASSLLSEPGPRRSDDEIAQYASSLVRPDTPADRRLGRSAVTALLSVEFVRATARSETSPGSNEFAPPIELEARATSTGVLVQDVGYGDIAIEVSPDGIVVDVLNHLDEDLFLEWSNSTLDIVDSRRPLKNFGHDPERVGESVSRVPPNTHFRDTVFPYTHEIRIVNAFRQFGSRWVFVNKEARPMLVEYMEGSEVEFYSKKQLDRRGEPWVVSLAFATYNPRRPRRIEVHFRISDVEIRRP